VARGGLPAIGETNGSIPAEPTAGMRAVVLRSARVPPMLIFLVSLSTVAIAEMGDRTQFLCLVLAARFRKPWAIIAGILVATLGDHLAAGAVGIWFGRTIAPAIVDAVVGCSMMAMALWTLFLPDRLGGDATARSRGAFVTTTVAFFLAELGDKTQLATLALAAAYSSLIPVVAGSTVGILVANAPVVFLGGAFAERLPMRAIRYLAAALFFILGAWFVFRASATCWPPLSRACH
jgi:Ca2+/H+ antiporter, TMEM165/GDT1 family